MVSLKILEGKSIYSTYGEGILSSTERTEMRLLLPCKHEEEDTRLMVHVLDAASSGHRRNRIRNNDTDVVVLAISVASTLPTDELWIIYGSGKNVRNTPALAITMSLGHDKASTLSMFHAPTRCDTVFFFLEGVEKNGSGRVERVSSTNTSAKSPQSITTRDHRGVKAVLEKFVILTYDRKAALRK